MLLTVRLLLFLQRKHILAPHIAQLAPPRVCRPREKPNRWNLSTLAGLALSKTAVDTPQIRHRPDPHTDQSTKAPDQCSATVHGRNRDLRYACRKRPPG